MNKHMNEISERNEVLSKTRSAQNKSNNKVNK